MSDAQTFLAFGALMVVVALLAIAVDWFGKPLRHRKFVPKMYRFPEERTPRGSSVRATEWSDRAFVLPVAPTLDLVRRPLGASSADIFDQDAREITASSPPSHPTVFAIDHVEPPTDTPTTVASPVESADESPGDEVPEPPESPDRRRRGWEPGGFVFNLTIEGDEPTPAVVRERYWHNVACTAGAAMFGTDNLERMSVGRPPRRRNPRTGRAESMTLPVTGHDAMGGQTPSPSWPSDELDPFAD